MYGMYDIKGLCFLIRIQLETANDRFGAERARLEEQIHLLETRGEEATQRIQALETDLQHAREELLVGQRREQTATEQTDALRQQMAGAERELANLRAQLRDRVLEIERASGEIQRLTRTPCTISYVLSSVDN